MGQVYTVEGQQPTTYLDEGQAVSGFVLTVRLHKWNELLVINVPQLKAELVDARVKQLIAEREALAKLGG